MTLLHDLRQGWREARSQAVVSAVAVLTLALGIGGATTMFATVRALQASTVPPGVDRARVGRIVWTSRDGAGRRPLSGDEFRQVARGATAFEAVSASADRSMALGGAPGRMVAAKMVTSAFFGTFGCRPSAGRTFAAADWRGTGRVAVVSEGLVRREPSLAVNGVLTLAGDDYGIVGVMPDACWFPSPGSPDAWLPMPLRADGVPEVPSVTVTFRLRNARDLERARAQARQTGEQLERAGPTATPGRLTLITLDEDAARRLGQGALGVLGPALLVLLIACANVANLLLARGARREREMAVRASLGAPRWRLARERLVEGAWLAAAGGVLGTGLGWAGARLLRNWVGSFEAAAPVAGAIRLDGRATLFALAVTMTVPLVFGVVPALAASRPDLVRALHQAPGPRPSRRGPYGTRDLLVVLQIGLAVILVVTTGMLGRFFAELNRVEWGFDASRVVAADLSFDSRPGGESARTTMLPRILEAVRAVPGVRAAAVGQVPGIPSASDGRTIQLEGCAAGTLPGVVSTAGPGYFEALGLRVVRGHAPGAYDEAAAPAGVIGEEHASRCWPGQDPIGRRFRVARDGPWLTVAAVVRDTMKTRAFPGAPRNVYLACGDARNVEGVLLVRFDGPASPVLGGVRAAIHGIDPSQALEGLRPLDEEFRRRMGGAPLLTGILGGFGLFALLLSGLGVFSVTCYSVAERTREFGIRTALGGSRLDVMRLVLHHALVIVGIGSCASAAGTLAVARLTFRDMADLAIADPVLWASVAALVGGVALAASALPAWRAVHVEPTVALRAE